ncbi:hypothetical protein Kalk_13915 [Ketobacter alkanivorans]|uniref:Nucleoside-diphosphate sugar epimerase n=2 Tax=Ketobacter alkanivorans TaxID=1917421 RepID=A0A2K9LMI4_9GAMM|nr:hypothetical protein Kalk_13915 [Ketobacter alkanivorans]
MASKMGTHQPMIYVLESKHIGSNIQLNAIANALQSNPDLINKLHCETRSRRSIFFNLYKIAAWALTRIENPSLKRIIAWACIGQHPEIEAGSFIIAKTAPFEYPALILSKAYSSCIIYMGAPKRIDHKTIATLISTPSTPAQHAHINLQTLPTSITFQQFTLSRRALTNQKKLTLLIGGNTKGYQYSEEFWERLCQYILDSSIDLEIEWTISTSPRTPETCTKILSKAFPKTNERIQLHLWHKDDERISLIDAISQCYILVTTEDSASMISEGVNARLPTVTIRPQGRGYNNLVTPMVEQLEESGKIIRCELNNLSIGQIIDWANSEKFRPLKKCWSEELTRQLLN